jgi:heptosyltransferase-2
VDKEFPKVKIALLGGKEDTERNKQIQAGIPQSVVLTPTEEGLRQGILYEAICDLIVTGDTLGMHIGIALKKYILAWFGMTSHQEIDLYDRGEKIISTVECSPCWSQKCLTGTLDCIHLIDGAQFVMAIKRIYTRWQKNKKV